MGVSNHDIALAIVANGQTAHYASLKGIGHIIWDLRTGIFAGKVPNADTLLHWVDETAWGEYTDRLQEPLKDPVYGRVTIDFDQKTVIDQNGWGDSTQMFFDWLIDSADAAVNGFDDEPLIPAESLLDHFQCGRIAVELDNRTLTEISAGTLKDGLKKLKALAYVDESADRLRLAVWGHLKLPTGWTHQSLGRIGDSNA